MADGEVTAARKTGTQAIERAIAILRRIADHDTPQSLTSVAKAVGLNTATTHRIMASLVRERFVSYDAATERYQIGPDAVLLFAAAARRYGISAARRDLDVVAATMHETVALGVLDGSDTVIVLQSESDLPLRFSRPVGTRVPVHVSAIGKAILAASDRDLAEWVDTLGELHSFTEHTITDRARLVGELELARERGWALNDSERYDGVRAIAVPVRRDGLDATAAVGLQGPVGRIPDSRLEEIVEALRACAGRLSLHLEITS